MTATTRKTLSNLLTLSSRIHAHTRTRYPIKRRTISSESLASSLDETDTAAPLSTVHRGTAFEHRAMSMLRALSMSLVCIGGRNDGGVDLQGWWWVPGSHGEVKGGKSEEGGEGMMDDAGIRRRRVRVLAQCKAERKKVGPNYVREMEGVLYRHLHDESNDTEMKRKPVPTIALLVSESAFTKATMLCALSSPLPFFLLHLPPSSSSSFTSQSHEDNAKDEEVFASAIWNPPLGGPTGVLGGAVELRWELLLSSRDSTMTRRPALWWNGVRLKNWVPTSER